MGDEFMDIWKECIDEALLSLHTDDVPIGAIIVDSMGNFVEKSHNTREATKSILGHAEINAIVKASQNLNRWNLADCDLFVTLKPCSMCMEVIKQSRIRNVYYLLDKPSTKKEYNKTEFIKESNISSEQMYHSILSDFFAQKR